MGIRKDEAFVEALTTAAPNSIIGEVVDAARRGYCNLYSTNPAWAFAKNTFVLPIVKRTLDNYCADFAPAPDPPPGPDFDGGQCPGEEYRVEAEYTLGTGGTQRDRGVNVFGPIFSVGFRLNASPNQYEIIVEATEAPPGTGPQTYVIDAYNPNFGPPDFVTVLSITRIDGQPDDCGDPPEPPYDEIPNPTDSDRIFDIDITNSAGDTFNYDVEIALSADGYINFPPIINVGGIEVGLDIGGVTINNVTNRPSSPGGGGGTGPVLDTEPEVEPELEEEVLEETEEPPERTVEKLVAITLTSTGNLTVFPRTDGNGGPNVYFIGWVEFRKGSFFYERQFINFLTSRFDAPEDADGYAITLKPGWATSVTEIKEKTEV